MITPSDRLKIAKSILDFEARRDKAGHLQIYKLPAADGGGTYEVGGINERYHPEEARHLADLINAGKFDEAEEHAIEIIGTFTDIAGTWSASTAVESYLRDCAFNRGPRGSARILQRALNVTDDGVVGKITRAALVLKEKDPTALLNQLRAAREQYERDVAGRDEESIFWKGLVNRWNNALKFALTFLPSDAKKKEALAVKLVDAKPEVLAKISKMSLEEKIDYYLESVKLTDLIPINEGLDPAQESTMVSLLGPPKLPLTTTDQPERASKRVKMLRLTKKVCAHVTVSGIRPSIESLETVLKSVFAVEPDLEEILGTEGMLNVRYRKPTSGKKSTKISNHSWGTAIDFKVIGHSAPGNTKGNVPRFIAVMLPHFNAHGWYSGIGFHDTMHFEVSDGTIKTWSKDGLFEIPK